MKKILVAGVFAFSTFFTVSAHAEYLPLLDGVSSTPLTSSQMASVQGEGELVKVPVNVSINVATINAVQACDAIVCQQNQVIVVGNGNEVEASNSIKVSKKKTVYKQYFKKS